MNEKRIIRELISEIRQLRQQKAALEDLRRDYYFDEEYQLWVPCRPWYANRAYDAFRALKLAWDIWRKPWQPRPDPGAEDYDPRADISLKTALAVAWRVWRLTGI